MARIIIKGLPKYQTKGEVKENCKDGYGCQGKGNITGSNVSKKDGISYIGEGSGKENYVPFSNAPLTWNELLSYNNPNIEGESKKTAKQMNTDYANKIANRTNSLQTQFPGLTENQLRVAGADSARIKQRITDLPTWDRPANQSYDRAWYPHYRGLMKPNIPVTVPQILQFQSQQPGGLSGYEQTVTGNYGKKKFVIGGQNIDKYQYAGQPCNEGYKKNEFGICVPDFESQYQEPVTEQNAAVDFAQTLKSPSVAESHEQPFQQKEDVKKPQNTFWGNTRGERRFNKTMTGFGLGSMALNKFDQYKKQKSFDQWQRDSMLPDNYNALNTSQDRGDYDINNGMFRPNLLGFKSKGMYSNIQYPQLNQAAEGMIVPGDEIVRPSFLSDPIIDLPSPIERQPSSQSAQPTSNQQVTTNSEYVLPVENFRITSGFGHRKAPKAGSSTEHNGLDLAVPINTPVRAPLDGVVENIYSNDKGGKQLLVRHSDGSLSGYAHLNGYNVNIGDPVAKGQTIALSGNTGRGTGAHLHFTWHDPSGNTIDPRNVFNFNTSVKSSNSQEISSSHNNPLNLHAGTFASDYGGIKGASDNKGNVAIFPDLATGIQANKDLLFGPRYNNLSIREARNKWVTGDPNGYNASTNPIIEAMGGNKKLSDLDDAEKDKLFKQFAKWEGKESYNMIKNTKIFKEGGQNNNTMKIKIIEAPEEFAKGGQPKYTEQSDYGLYLGQRNMYSSMPQNTYENTSKSVTEEEPTKNNPHVLEAEGEETILTPDGKFMNINGPSHANGGVKLTKEQAPAKSFIYSKTAAMKIKNPEILKHFGKSYKKGGIAPAELSKQYDLNKYTAILQDPNTDVLAKDTAKKMVENYQKKLAELAIVQESMKGFPQGIPDIAKSIMPEAMQNGSQPQEAIQPQAKYGGSLRKFVGGGPNDTDPFGTKSLLLSGNPPRKSQFHPEWNDEGINPESELEYSPNEAYNGPSSAHAFIGPLLSDALIPYHGDKYQNKENASKYSSREWVDKLKARGYKGTSFDPIDVQKWIYTNPEAKKIVDALHDKHKGIIYGGPKEGKYDAKLGYRWDDALDAIPVKTVPGKRSDYEIPETPGNIPEVPGDIPDIPGTPPPGTETPEKDLYVPPKKGWTSQDLRNRANAIADYATLKKYHPWSAAVQPVLPEMVPVDWRGYAASLQSGANSAAQQMGTYQPGQAQAANLSFLAGQQAENLGKYIGQTDVANAGAATQLSGQRADLLNKFNQYNAERRNKNFEDENILDASYRQAERDARKGIVKTQNQGEENAANLYNLNLVESPYYTIDPYTKERRFNSDAAKAAWIAATKGGPQDMTQSQIDQYNKLYEGLPGSEESKRSVAMAMLGLTGSTPSNSSKRTKQDLLLKGNKDVETTYEDNKNTVPRSKYGGGTGASYVKTINNVYNQLNYITDPNERQRLAESYANKMHFGNSK